ncbi:hypothetical protein QIW31_06910 [Francisellaceae bacterium CB299]|jgi:hypothetical protein
MFFKKKNLDEEAPIYDIIKPKCWKLLNWLVFCSFSLILCSYLNAVLFFSALIFSLLVALAIKLYLMNRLPPADFRVYILIFLLVFIICEYHHLEIVLLKSFKITTLDYQHYLLNPGIFVGALCNVIFSTKIQVAPTLFFSEDFIQWASSYIGGSEAKVLLKIDGVFFALFGYVVPVIINMIYAMLIGVIAVRLKQLFHNR